MSSLMIAQRLENEKITKHLIFIEAGGASVYGSINYEYLFKKISKLKLSTRIGISSYRLKDYTNKFNPDIILPLTINAYYGTKHHIDIGFGPTITSFIYADKRTYQPNRRINYNTNLFIGYRYQKEVNGIMFKIGYSPIIEKENMFKHWYLLAFGYIF